MEQLRTIWPTLADMAADLGCPYPTVASWPKRGIPHRRFASIIAAARRRGADLTFEQLLAMSADATAKPNEDAA